MFRHFERLGQCEDIPVNIIQTIPVKKMTTNNGGVSVVVRGIPGGYWYQRASANTVPVNVYVSPACTAPDVSQSIITAPVNNIPAYCTPDVSQSVNTVRKSVSPAYTAPDVSPSVNSVPVGGSPVFTSPDVSQTSNAKSLHKARRRRRQRRRHYWWVIP